MRANLFHRPTTGGTWIPWRPDGQVCPEGFGSIRGATTSTGVFNNELEATVFARWRHSVHGGAREYLVLPAGVMPPLPETAL